MGERFCHQLNDNTPTRVRWTGYLNYYLGKIIIEKNKFYQRRRTTKASVGVEEFREIKSLL